MVALLVLLAVVVQLLDGIPQLEYALTLTFTMFDSENFIINWLVLWWNRVDTVGPSVGLLWWLLAISNFVGLHSDDAEKEE